jgi:hypothetical protein
MKSVGRWEGRDYPASGGYDPRTSLTAWNAIR